MPATAEPARSPIRLHTYPASFGDDFARELISQNMDKGDNLLDPWIGSGTGPIQASMLGINGIGIDIDPIACLISRVSLAHYDIDELNSLFALIDGKVGVVESELSACDFSQEKWSSGTAVLIDGVQSEVPANSAIDFWFAPVQRALLAFLVEVSRSIQDQRYRAIVELAISASIIHKWPNTISLAMDIDHSRPHRVQRENITVDSQTKVFRKVFRDIIGHLKVINESERDSLTSWEIIEGDTKASLRHVAANSIDYILTSPPYFNAIDYPRSHKFSQWWLWPDRQPLSKASYLGLMPGFREHEVVVECRSIVPEYQEEIDALLDVSPSIHQRLCKYIVELNGVVVQFKTLLKRGGKATLVVGNNVIQGHNIPTSQILATMLERSGLTNLQIEPRKIRADRRRYPYGIRGFKGPMESEFIVNARKLDKS